MTLPPGNAPHRWMLDIDVDATQEQAAAAIETGTLLVKMTTKVDVLMVRCSVCLASYENCHEQPCRGRRPPRRRR